MKLNPPVVENKSPAQTNVNGIMIPFQMNRSVGWADFTQVVALIKTVQTNSHVATLYCNKEALYVKNGVYQGSFSNGSALPFKIGQYYKVQLAYKGTDGVVGFYSSTTTFKFTSSPTVTIQNLTTGATPNIHKYDYTGYYTNPGDASEKVYSYQFDLYDIQGVLVASSGEQLHNSSKDTDTSSSIDEWTTRYGLQSDLVYNIVYKVKTINGLECSSPSYKITDNQTVPSNVFKYCNFVATNIADSACVELSLQPKKSQGSAVRKLLNGKFILLRSSSEDNFQSWHELTRFILTSWDPSFEKSLCKDYSVSQGVKYIYALQAYNNQGIYSEREESDLLLVDFEDMFLSDGDRQLRVKYNPKVSSIKNTILESKLDTLGGKYPFFFRNGNVKYKEFPISGLISMLMDENEEFMTGIQLIQNARSTTPAYSEDYDELSTQLTGDNFRRERDFKFEVLEWLTNGKPKLFRSPGEGSYIVRLMNTSLTPNDTLSRMLHTFQSTAYEIADFTFENLRKYGMLMDDYIETRELNFFNVKLHEKTDGKISGINASLATVTAQPSTEFYYKLQNDTVAQKLIIGPTGVYEFPKTVLAETPLVEIYHEDGIYGWMPGATLVYATYRQQEVDNFSYIHSIEIKDKIAQIIGNNKSFVKNQFDEEQLIKSLGVIYYLNIQKRPIMPVDTVTWSGGRYIFKIGDIEYHPDSTTIVYGMNTKKYYDGKTLTEIGDLSNINFTIKLRENEDYIDLFGANVSDEGSSLANRYGCSAITSMAGRIILNNVRNVDYLFIGNGLYVDIAYQEVNKTYTTEVTPGSLVYMAKEAWQKGTGTFEYYYNLLKSTIQREVEDLIINAI